MSRLGVNVLHPAVVEIFHRLLPSERAVESADAGGINLDIDPRSCDISRMLPPPKGSETVEKPLGLS